MRGCLSSGMVSKATALSGVLNTCCDHARQCVVQTGRQSSSLGRQPDLRGQQARASKHPRGSRSRILRGPGKNAFVRAL